jgi:3-oxoacyl-[acyl-carrier-protein] synthase III
MQLGIAGIGIYAPETCHTAEYISGQTGIPRDVLVERFGLSAKRRAGEEEHVTAMGHRAAASALEAAGVEPGQIDLLIYHGSQYKEYQPWSAACRLQELVGARRAQAFEVYSLCAGAPVAMRTARALMREDARIRTALLVTATRESHLIDYTNQRTRFLFNIGDGAAAAVLRREHPQNRILGCAMRSDGSFAMDVIVPDGRLDVPDPAGMKERLDPVSFPNFLAVVDEALAEAGLGRADVRFLAATHMKRSLHTALLEALGLTWEQTYYLSEYGHLQSADQYIALWEGARRGLLKPGDVAVLAAAGTGYTWSAAAVRWG